MKKAIFLLGIGLIFAAMSLGNAYSQEVVTAQCGVPQYHKGVLGSVQYVMGGVGLEERALLKSMAKDYNLKLEFAVTSGEYLSQPNVLIEHAKGKVLEAVSLGPWFMVKLPAGDYKVSVSRTGKTQVQTVKVGKGMTTKVFYWKD